MAAFTIRDFATLAAQMVAGLAALATDINDYSEGAVARSILETVAVQLQRLDVAVFQGLKEAIEIGTYKNFDFYRLPASYSMGTVTFSRSGDLSQAVTVPLGTRASVPGSAARVYQTLVIATMAAGVDHVDVPVRCQTAGTQGNTPANTVVTLVDLLSFIATVTNARPFLTGLDQETDADRRARFRTFIQGLGRGTRAAIEFAASSVLLADATGATVERVTSAKAREPFMDDEAGRLGLVQLYVDNGTGSASAELLAKVGDTVRGFVNGAGAVQKGWIAAGVDLQVFGVSALPLDALCAITVAAGFVKADVAAAAKSAVEGYLASLQVFESAILSKMIEAVMEVEGVTDVTFSSPAANVAPALSQRVVAGVVTVTSA